jgi:hypothetical protein
MRVGRKKCWGYQECPQCTYNKVSIVIVINNDSRLWQEPSDAPTSKHQKTGNFEDAASFDAPHPMIPKQDLLLPPPALTVTITRHVQDIERLMKMFSKLHRL